MPAINAPKTRRPKRQMDRLFAEHDGSMVVHWTPPHPMDDEQLLRFCRENGDLRIEQNAEGELIIMPPAFGDSGSWELELGTDLMIWARNVGGGKAFGPSAGFRLPDGSVRAPDASWVSQARLEALPPGALHSFTPVCPEFVLELRSGTDRLSILKAKMAEYVANGAHLGWLIDPLEKQVFVYRPGQPVEHLKNPSALSGEPVLPGFVLDVSRVW